MSNISHRDDDGDFSFDSANLSGRGSPEGEVTATYGSLYRRTDGTPDTTLYVKGGTPGSIDNTGWVPLVSASGGNVDTRLDALEATDAAQVTTNSNLNAAIVSEAATRAAADTSLGTRTTALEAKFPIQQTDIGTAQVTYSKISDFASGTLFGRCQSGIGPAENIYLGSSLELPTGTSQLLRRAALTGDVTAAADSNTTTIANLAVTTGKIAASAVTNAKLADMATATFKGRTTAGTGAAEDLTVTQATALLNAANATTKGLVPTPPNNTTTFLRGDATFAAPKQRLVLWYGGAVMTAGNTDRFGNPPGFSTSPIGATALYFPCPVAGSLIATIYRTNTAHTSSTVTITPRVNGVEQTTQTATISANDTEELVTHATPLTVSALDAIACQMDHNGATNLANFMVGFVIEY